MLIKKLLKTFPKAIDQGYDDLEWLQTDDSIESIREDKLFGQIIEQLKKDKNK